MSYASDAHSSGYRTEKGQCALGDGIVIVAAGGAGLAEQTKWTHKRSSGITEEFTHDTVKNDGRM